MQCHHCSPTLGDTTGSRKPLLTNLFLEVFWNTFLSKWPHWTSWLIRFDRTLIKHPHHSLLVQTSDQEKPLSLGLFLWWPGSQCDWHLMWVWLCLSPLLNAGKNKKPWCLPSFCYGPAGEKPITEAIFVKWAKCQVGGKASLREPIHSIVPCQC